MMAFGYLPDDLLARAYHAASRPDEICFKPSDVRAAINACTLHGKTIDALSVYFREGDEVYCPQWGDCLMLSDGNTAYLQLFDGLQFEQQVSLDMVYELVARFALVMPDNYDWTTDATGYKESVALEIAGYNLNDLYFCLQLN